MAFSFRLWFVLILSFSGHSFAQTCPGADDEPALAVKTKTGTVLVVCGFEDHELKSPKNKRAFSEFSIYHGQKGLFTSEPSEIYWLGELENANGLELIQVWFVDEEEPIPAIRREVICEGESCRITSPTCVFKLKKKNPYPTALKTFERSQKKLGEAGEELLDHIWLQALSGDTSARRFYEGSPPNSLDADLREIFEGNKSKLKQANDLKCKPSK